jgi:hypothetical protein
MRVLIEWQMQHGAWHRYQMMNHYANAYRTAKARAQATGKRHRLVDETGMVMDLIT